ncbi:O-antigen ligase family protein [Qipengyuania gelatinilytica]|uniref:O-antigen ligase family protein n=1 Tax=Qipengyuania gelatinilytica TaxID=2867231 RepID=A0ABX9A3H2_9SPHN|nr:O-antigen ligase family protein [Qipengyuania gelatinilytica]QZD94864.1 O-antigen ligase family protein [Qipengyuania gelatinilytica]
MGIGRHGRIAAGFIACAMVLGGGGSPSPAAEMLVQLAFVAALLAWLWWASGEAPRISRPLLYLGLAFLALPLLQLIPLPPAIWQALPGRELEIASLAVISAEDSWRPLSISPPLTLAAFLVLVPAVGTMWAVSTLSRRDRHFLMLVIAVMGLCSAFLGALQLVGGPDAFRLYEKSHRGWLTAFHANRNAAADVLLIASLALGAWFASQRDESRRKRISPMILIAQIVFLVAVLLTGSRAGIALLLVALVVHWVMIRGEEASRRSKALIAGAGLLAGALLSLPFLLGGGGRLAGVAARFDATSDARIPLWTDTLAAIESFGWAGSGLGSFTKAFLPHESLEHLVPAFPNRAHNDYLEFVLEAGLLAPVLLAIAAITLGALVRRAWRVSPSEHYAQLFAIGTLAIVALHSVVDYPLRNVAIACLAATAAGLLAPSPGGSKGRERRDSKT